MYYHTLALHAALPISDRNDAISRLIRRFPVQPQHLAREVERACDQHRQTVIRQRGNRRWRIGECARPWPESMRRMAILHRNGDGRSEEHKSELKSLMRISYAVFWLKKKKTNAR